MKAWEWMEYQIFIQASNKMMFVYHTNNFFKSEQMQCIRSIFIQLYHEIVFIMQ